MVKEEKVKEEMVTLRVSVDEIVQDIHALKNDEDVELFLKVEEGRRKWIKFIELSNILDEFNKKKKK